MNTVSFTKMEGAGNDFIVIDNRNNIVNVSEIIKAAPRLCNRRYGVGADGILLFEQPKPDTKADYAMVYRNADGSDAGMCGNGSRCLALYAHTHGFGNNLTFTVHNAVYSAIVHPGNESITVYFPPIEMPEKILLESEEYIKVYAGTEHVVKFVDLDFLSHSDKICDTGRKIRYSAELNPPGTNVNFVHTTKDNVLNLATYERGVETITPACGTGAIAAAVADCFKHTAKNGFFSYEVLMKGGRLKVTFDFDSEAGTFTNIGLVGPAHRVFEGSIDV